MKINIHAIDRALEAAKESMQRCMVPGLALCVLRDGQIEAVKTLGLADPVEGTPVTEDTHFEAASLTKTVFSKIIHQMVQKGELDLDIPLYEIVPEKLPTEDPRGKEITPRQVLSHGTGLPGWGETPLPLLFAPGEGFGYSGKAYTYLQDAVEKIFDRRIDDIMQTAIFNPLKMEDACMIWTGPLNRSLARTVNAKGEIEPKRARCQRSVALEPNCAFSLCVTIRDYPKFLMDIMQDEEYLAMVQSWRNPADHGVEWGLGWGIYKELLWHWGDNGGFKSFVCFDPKTKDGILIHTSGENGLEVCYEIASLVCDFCLDDIREMVECAE